VSPHRRPAGKLPVTMSPRHRALAAALATLILGVIGARRPPHPPADLVLTGGRYLDVRAGVLRSNGAIEIRNGRIAAIHPPGSSWRPSAHARAVALDQRVVIPGLIDAHVHLTLAGDPAANALATLRAGFTTVADLGSAGGAGIRLRDDIAAGRVAGPRIVAAGSWIGVKGGVCEFGGATVATPDEAGRRARADLDAGADLLKACITGWPAEAVAFPDSVQMGDALLAPVLTAARARKRPVYAHAIGQAGALLAAHAGVRALAHTPVVDSSGAARLRASGVRVISTLATLTSGAAGPDVLASFRRLRQAGVPIVLGTDAGVLPHGQNARELLALTKAGLPPLEALRAATVDAAALLELRDAGEIVTGARADLVIVEGDPLADVLVTGRPLMVIAAGRVVE
jgi:imidazolonepropionase-like amidohydrolase